MMAMALPPAWGGNRPPRIWILPFDNPHGDASVGHLEEAIPALLAVAISQSDQHAVVDRQHLNRVLAELSMTLEGLTAQNVRREVGRLLGATVMISGSFVKRGQDLLIAMRASDLETGIVTAAAETRGPAAEVSQLVADLYRRLGRDLGRELPDLRADQIDEAPVSNLHFMRGLGHYYSARYNQALAEFIQAAREKGLTDIAGLWQANSYLAQEHYAHAYLELSRLRRGAPANFRKAEIETKMVACERRLSAEDVKMIREMAALPASAKE
jgi:TolB-like protein